MPSLKQRWEPLVVMQAMITELQKFALRNCHSSEYLQSLETKLSKLTGARESSEKKTTEACLVQDLARAREDALINFVTSGDNRNNSENFDLDSSIEVHPLARRLVPEPAITVGEQVVLTKGDQLEKEQEKDSECGQ